MYLENCIKTASPQNNFFESSSGSPSVQFPVDSNSNAEDSSILFTSVDHHDHHAELSLDSALGSLPTIDLSAGAQKDQDEEASSVDYSRPLKEYGTPLKLQFFNVPKKNPVRNTIANHSEVGFLGYCLDSGAAKSVVGEQQ